MKCPLITAGFWADPNALNLSAVDCLKEECAWYHDGLEDCGLFLIQENLALITAQLVELNRAMPPSQSFVK